ncbi:uncharacterized protein METZ01_LOCUS489067, partial [marine metagenome]
MDRKTLLAFGLIAVVLILTPWYMDLVAPARAPLPADTSRSETSPLIPPAAFNSPESSSQTNSEIAPVDEKT